MLWLLVAAFALRLAQSIYLSLDQYFAWSVDKFSKILLTLPPEHPGLYFARYVFYHFWLSFLISLLIASLFAILLLSLKKHRPQAFTRNEIFIFLTAMILVGWPNVIYFIAGVLVLMIPAYFYLPKPLGWCAAISAVAIIILSYISPSLFVHLSLLRI